MRDSLEELKIWIEKSKEIHYHGTKSDFDTFSKKGTGKHGSGYYFTPDKNEAKSFSRDLHGDGSKSQPKIFHAKLDVKTPFNTMNVDHAKKVAEHHGIEYKAPKKVGGPKEHYHHLESQMHRAGKLEGKKGKSNFNDKIKEAGFDHVHYDFMNHKIAFEPKHIKVIKKENLEKSRVLNLKIWIEKSFAFSHISPTAEHHKLKARYHDECWVKEKNPNKAERHKMAAEHHKMMARKIVLSQKNKK